MISDVALVYCFLNDFLSILLFHKQKLRNGCHDPSFQSLTDLRIITIESGGCMVFSNISYEEINRLLKSNDLNEKLGYF